MVYLPYKQSFRRFPACLTQSGRESRTWYQKSLSDREAFLCRHNTACLLTGVEFPEDCFHTPVDLVTADSAAAQLTGGPALPYRLIGSVIDKCNGDGAFPYRGGIGIISHETGGEIVRNNPAAVPVIIAA